MLYSEQELAHDNIELFDEPQKEDIKGFIIEIEHDKRVIKVDGQTPQDPIMVYKLRWDPEQDDVFKHITDRHFIRLSVIVYGDEIDEEDEVYGGWLLGEVDKTKSIDYHTPSW